jgi:NAD(P)-dependent dehydrogenase (short-subunit alcohol dehydrogenase family)
MRPKEESPTALITGATGGLGRRIALSLARDRYKLFLHGRDIVRLAALSAEIEGKGAPRPQLLQARFDELDQVASLCDQVAGKTARLDLLINNAGTGFEATDPLTIDGYRRSFQVNYLAPCLLMHRLLPLIRQGEGSAVINIASLAQADLPPSLSSIDKAPAAIAYGRSKLALIMATQSFAEAMGSYGPKLFALHPGSLLDTQLTRSLLKQMPAWVGFCWRLLRPLRPTVEEAAAFVTSFATDVSKRPSGSFWTAKGPGRARPQASDPQARATLEAFTKQALDPFLRVPAARWPWTSREATTVGAGPL